MSAIPPAQSGQVVVDSSRTADLNAQIRAAAAREPGDPASAPSDYVLGSNDLINVVVFNADAFSGQFRVEESGSIAVPLLGPIEAAGKTTRELETHLAERLGEEYMRDPHVSIQVVEMQSHGVSVVGAVRTPGIYQISGPSTLLEVLAMAEGLSPEAGNEVVVVRAEDAAIIAGDPVSPAATGDLAVDEAAAASADVVEVDLGALLDGRAQQNVLVYPGDIVQVRPAGLVYVVGQVNRPGGFAVPAGQPMTALQAVAMAEGLGNTAAASRAVIVRELPDGSRQEIPVDLESVMEGSEPAPTLMASDVLFIPNNGAKSFALGVVNALVGMVTFRGLFY